MPQSEADSKAWFPYYRTPGFYPTGLDKYGGRLQCFFRGLMLDLRTTGDPQKAVDYGAAHGALAMTTPGDTSMASKTEVEKLMKGGGARVQR